ncbi:DUF975 family protein [Exiguobacterium artemiae]
MSSQLKKSAKEALSGRWGFTVLMFLLFGILQGIPNLLSSDYDEPFQMIDFIGLIVTVLLIPLSAGWGWFALSIARGEKTKISDLFEPYKYFVKVVLLSIVQFIFLFLWALLLVVPAIIKSFSYMLTYYILRDEPSIGVLEAITRSRQMMDGHKMEAFLLILSFIGWFLLGVITIGIGFLWIIPYVSVTLAKFYDRIRGEEAPVEESTFVAPY